jgi:hypothetical protein
VAQLAGLLGVPGQQVHRPRPGHPVGRQAGPVLELPDRGGQLVVSAAGGQAEVVEQGAQADRVGGGRPGAGPADQAADGGADHAEHSVR